jgi:lysozyme family protein
VTDFPAALDYVLGYEDPEHLYAVVQDNNGADVISGINSAYWPEQYERIAACAREERAAPVAAFYQDYYWDPLSIASIDDQDVANRVLDACVSCGAPAGIKQLQRAVFVTNSNVVIDGVLGPITLTAVNSANASELLSSFRAQRLAYYKQVAALHPTDEDDLADWIRRANG